MRPHHLRQILGLGLLSFMMSAPAGHAALLDSPPPDPATLCDAAIAVVERAHALPPHLLGAIGRVETGRRNPVTGAFAPWPWTIDVEGEGHLYETEAAAIAAVRHYQAAGRRSIDVGCLQVNLQQHPDAFATLEAAFDPMSNTEAAANFLDALHAQTQDWATATGRYHSATQTLAGPYQTRVAEMMQQSDGRSILALAAPAPFAAPLLAMTLPPAGPVAATLRGFQFRARSPPLPTLPTGPGRSLAAYRAAPVARARR